MIKHTHTQNLQWMLELFPFGFGETFQQEVTESSATEDVWVLAKMEIAGLFMAALWFLQ